MLSQPGAPAPELTVLIVLWNCAPFIGDCLGSLDQLPESVEVLCYDNASSDASAAIAEAAGCVVVRSQVNVGFPRAVNALLPLVQTPRVLLLNPDVTLRPNTLSLATPELDDPTVAVVGANLRRRDGRPDPPAARRFRTLGTIALESFGLSKLWHRLDVQYFPTWDRSDSRDVPCVNGAFMLLRTEDLQAVGGLDESVFLYLEDQLLCHELGARGRRIRFCADAIAQHVGGGPTEAGSLDQRAVAYHHRLDASLEIVRIRQGAVAQKVAALLLLVRCIALFLIGTVRRDPATKLKYRSAIRWLLAQLRTRRPPAPVPRTDSRT